MSDNRPTWKKLLDNADMEIEALKGESAELLASLIGCADALHECAKMLRQMGCPGHATVADIHQEAARKAIAKARGE